jgi:hypothetical protein
MLGPSRAGFGSETHLGAGILTGFWILEALIQRSNSIPSVASFSTRE